MLWESVCKSVNVKVLLIPQHQRMSKTSGTATTNLEVGKNLA